MTLLHGASKIMKIRVFHPSMAGQPNTVNEANNSMAKVMEGLQADKDPTPVFRRTTSESTSPAIWRACDAFWLRLLSSWLNSWSTQAASWAWQTPKSPWRQLKCWATANPESAKELDQCAEKGSLPSPVSPWQSHMTYMIIQTFRSPFRGLETSLSRSERSVFPYVPCHAIPVQWTPLKAANFTTVTRQERNTVIWCKPSSSHIAQSLGHRIIFQ